MTNVDDKAQETGEDIFDLGFGFSLDSAKQKAKNLGKIVGGMTLLGAGVVLLHDVIDDVPRYLENVQITRQYFDSSDTFFRNYPDTVYLTVRGLLGAYLTIKGSVIIDKL